MKNEHLLPYLGFRQDGRMGLFVSLSPISIAGERLWKPERWSDLVTNFQLNPTPEMAGPALISFRKFLAGEEVIEETPEFGVPLERKRRKTR